MRHIKKIIAVTLVCALVLTMGTAALAQDINDTAQKNTGSMQIARTNEVSFEAHYAQNQQRPDILAKVINVQKNIPSETQAAAGGPAGWRFNLVSIILLLVAAGMLIYSKIRENHT